MPKATDPAIKAAVLSDYAAGVPCDEILKKHGISQGSLWNWTRAAKLKRSSPGPAHEITEKDEKEILRRFSDGETSPQIAEVIGCTPTTVRNVLERNGVERRTPEEIGALKHLLSDEQEDDIVARYESGEPAAPIAAAYGVTDKYVYQILERHSVKMQPRGPRPREGLREGVFAEPTGAALYWPGVLMADGCIDFDEERSARVTLNLAAVDAGHVRSFCGFLGLSDEDARECRRVNPSVRAETRSDRLVAALARYGVVPGKTSRERATDLCSMSPHFWRGYIDGDGSYSPQHGKPRIEVVGSRALLEQFRSFLAFGGINFSGAISPHSGTCQMHITKALAVEAINLLYKNATVFLPRKKEAAVRLLALA